MPPSHTGMVVSDLIAWAGGIATTVSVVVTAMLALAKGRRDGRLEGERLVMEQDAQTIKNMASSVETMQAVVDKVRADMDRETRRLERQSEQLTAQQTQIADLNRRITDATHKNDIAIHHIAAREAWVMSNFEKRPPGLPKIPGLLSKEVEKVINSTEAETEIFYLPPHPDT